MNLMKFSILDRKENQTLDTMAVDVLINLDHLVSIKPINMMIEGKVLHGYWIRLANGKKYRAIQIPPALEKLFEGSDDAVFQFNPNFAIEGDGSAELLN